jgi:hypothetical protein
MGKDWEIFLNLAKTDVKICWNFPKLPIQKYQNTCFGATTVSIMTLSKTTKRLSINVTMGINDTQNDNIASMLCLLVFIVVLWFVVPILRTRWSRFILHFSCLQQHGQLQGLRRLQVRPGPEAGAGDKSVFNVANALAEVLVEINPSNIRICPTDIHFAAWWYYADGFHGC